MNGKLGNGLVNTGVSKVIYTVPDTIAYASLSINIVNTNVVDAKVCVVISNNSVFSLRDYVEYDSVLEPNAVLERGSFLCSPGEIITILSNVDGVVARIHGLEEEDFSTVNGPSTGGSIPLDGTGATGIWNIDITGNSDGINSNLPVTRLNDGINASINSFWRGDGTWASGAQGTEGPAGPQGIAGPAGPAGAQGPIGPSGPQGTIGLTGTTGATGATGAQGPTGSTGPVGPAGPTGTNNLVTAGPINVSACLNQNMTNTTGKVLHISAVFKSAFSNNVMYQPIGYVNGLIVGKCAVINWSTAWETFSTLTFMVPIGAYFQITTPGSTAITLYGQY